MLLVEQEQEDHEIWIEQDFLHLIDLNTNVFSALYCRYDTDTKEFEGDYSFYVFYDNDTGQELYWEQGSSLEVCIHNYLHCSRELESKFAEAGDLRCSYRLDDGAFLIEKVISSPHSEDGQN